jgi:hypothetical protein
MYPCYEAPQVHVRKAQFRLAYSVTFKTEAKD